MAEAREISPNDIHRAAQLESVLTSVELILLVFYRVEPEGLHPVADKIAEVAHRAPQFNSIRRSSSPTCHRVNRSGENATIFFGPLSGMYRCGQSASIRENED
jgi:hypothetical protein